MADIKTLVEEAKDAAREFGLAMCRNNEYDNGIGVARSRKDLHAALDALAEAHQAEVARLTREAEDVRRKWLGHRDTGHLSLIEAADHVVGGLHEDIDRLTRENEGLAKALGEIAWSNDSKWQSDRADAALAGASGAQEGERT